MKREKWFLFLVYSYLLIPLMATFFYSFFREWNSIFPSGFTFAFYEEIFKDMEFWLSIGRTIAIAGTSVFLCIVVVLFAMYVILVYHPKWESYMKLVCTLPYAIQGVILPICIIALYANAISPFDNRILMLISTYCIVILPYVYQGIKNNLNGVPIRTILEASQMLGGGKGYTFFSIIVPNIKKGILVSSMLAIAIVFGDFVVVNMLAGTYFKTAQIYLYEVMKQSSQKTCAIIMVLFLITFLISFFVFKKDYKRIDKER